MDNPESGSIIYGLLFITWIIALLFFIPAQIAAIAKQKGYNYWFWLFASPLLNIFALLIVIGLKDKIQETKNQAQFEEMQKINNNLEQLIEIEGKDSKVRDILSKI